MDGKLSDEQLAEAMRVAKAAASAMPLGSTSERVNEAAIRAVLGLRFQPAGVTVKRVDRYDMYANHDGERAWPSPELAAQGEWVKFADLPALETQEEEAVAWRWKWGTGGDWFYGLERPDTEHPRSPYRGKLSAVEPLYLHPTPVQKEEEGQTVSEAENLATKLREHGNAHHEVCETMHRAADHIEALEVEVERLKCAIATPEAVHANMMRGGIPKLSIRSALHLHGEGALATWDRAEASEARATSLEQRLREAAETENFREPGEFGEGATMRRERE